MPQNAANSSPKRVMMIQLITPNKKLRKVFSAR